MKTRILVPPGIGDIYWVLVKLRSFIETNGLETPELTVVSHPDEFGSHLRSIDFLKMVPWVAIGEPPCVPNAEGLDAIWREAYLGPGRSVFPGVMGYDYLVAYNGCINSGGWIDTADSYECMWDISMVQSPAVNPVNKNRDFMLCFFPFIGTYVSHERDFPIPLIAETINKFASDTGLTPVFAGGKTEQHTDTRRHELLKLVPSGIDMIGQTSFKEIMGLVKGSRILYGYHSGIPNLGAASGKPSVFLWDNRYPDSTAYACMPPAVRETTYHAMQTKGLAVDDVLYGMQDVLDWYDYTPSHIRESHEGLLRC